MGVNRASAALLILAPMILGPGVLAASVSAGIRSSEDVQVVVDMDAASPGIQGHVVVPPGTSVVEDVGVYVFDPSGKRQLWGIGYIGGLDRGIAFGHVPSNQNHGFVVSLVPSGGVPINTGNTTQELLSPAQYPGFPGPEVQYLEWGAERPGRIWSQPDAPVFVVDIRLEGAEPGDVFDFYLLDMVTVWSGGGHGAFSTSQPINSLDTGGDAVLDGTQSAYGVDPDAGIPVPPAAYRVDYVDGGDGPATVRVSSVTAVEPPGGRVGGIRMHPVHPDPFTSTATVRFDIGEPSRVRLAVFDMAGRLVRVLVDESTPLEQGRHVSAWNGVDADGHATPAGIYVIRLEARGASATRRVVRLR